MLRAMVLALAVSALCAHASAQSPLAGIRARYAGGDFAGTLTESERVERETTLSRDELLAMLELRALAYRALGDEAQSDRTLRTIASIDPDRALSAEMPPVMRARFAALAGGASGPPRIEARPRVEAGRFELTVLVEGDPERVVDRVELRARVPDGEWETVVAGALSFPVLPGARIEWEARALGPASAELAAQRGIEVAPGGAGNDDALWIGLGIGIGAAVIGAVIAILVVTLSAGVDTEVEGPVLGALRF